MPRLALLALAAALTGCAALKAGTMEGATEKKWLVAAAGLQFKCARTSVVAIEDGAFGDFGPGYPWSVVACGQDAICRLRDGAAVTTTEGWECRSKPTPKEAAALQPGQEGYAEAVAAARKQTGECRDLSPQVWVLRKKSRGEVLGVGVELCGREFGCALAVNAKNDVQGEGECTETDESVERTTRSVVTDRLALETGCPAGSIEVVAAADWRRGTERGFRLRACGKPYVCTTAPGRTDCKAALDQGPSGGPDAGSETRDGGAP